MADFQVGLFDCLSDIVTCLIGCFAPCYLTAQSLARVDGRECVLCDCCCQCNPNWVVRTRIRSKYGLQYEYLMALVARQFVEISRARIESLLTAFPKLVANSSKQYTFVDGPGVRFVYQPMDELYAIVITNKASNIVEDLETLQLLTNIISETCGTTNEMAVTAKSFELIFAFDEIVSLGNKEKLNIAQVKQLLAMDSQEEKMAEANQRNQEMEAIKEANRRGKELEARRAEEARMGRSGHYGGMSSGISSMSSSSSQQPFAGGRSSQPYIEPRRQEQTKPAAASTGPARKGLSLTSSATKGSDYLDALKQEMGAAAGTHEAKEMLRAAGATSPTPASTSPALANAPPATMRDDVHVSITEKMVVQLDKDGNVTHFEVRGELDVFISKEQFSKVSVQLNPKLLQSGLDFKVHPNYHKPKFMQDGLLTLRDASKSFTVNAPNGVLKWRMVSQDSSKLPLLVNCWPSSSGSGTTTVNMEYEARRGLELHDVVITIPIVAKNAPMVTSVNGETHFDVKNSVLLWTMPIVDSSNGTGNLDFEFEQWRVNDAAHLFPINVAFSSSTSLCDVSVVDVKNGNNQSVQHSTHSMATVEKYTIE